jgi:hypothetical protein
MTFSPRLLCLYGVAVIADEFSYNLIRALGVIKIRQTLKVAPIKADQVLGIGIIGCRAGICD